MVFISSTFCVGTYGMVPSFCFLFFCDVFSCLCTYYVVLYGIYVPYKYIWYGTTYTLSTISNIEVHMWWYIAGI
jgi:hypothetical protein